MQDTPQLPVVPTLPEGVKVLPYGSIGPAFGEATEEGSFEAAAAHSTSNRHRALGRRPAGGADPTPPRLPLPASDPLSFLDSFDDQVQGALDLQQLTEWQQRLQASSAGVAARMLHVIKQGRAGSSRLDEPE